MQLEVLQLRNTEGDEVVLCLDESVAALSCSCSVTPPSQKGGWVLEHCSEGRVRVSSHALPPPAPEQELHIGIPAGKHLLPSRSHGAGAPQRDESSSGSIKALFRIPSSSALIVFDTGGIPTST